MLLQLSLNHHKHRYQAETIKMCYFVLQKHFNCVYTSFSKNTFILGWK